MFPSRCLWPPGLPLLPPGCHSASLMWSLLPPRWGSGEERGGNISVHILAAGLQLYQSLRLMPGDGRGVPVHTADRGHLRIYSAFGLSQMSLFSCHFPVLILDIGFYYPSLKQKGTQIWHIILSQTGPFFSTFSSAWYPQTYLTTLFFNYIWFFNTVS